MTQRKLYGHLHDDDVLPEIQERIDLLDDIDFSWDPYEEQWILRYKELKAYKDEHGDTLVPSRSKDGLGNWVHHQGVQHDRFVRGEDSLVSQKRIQLLNDIGFVWDQIEEQWMRRYNELKSYREKQGNPAGTHNGLGSWVKYQRMLSVRFLRGEDSPMTQERLQLLRDIGFVWEVKEKQWLQRYNELKAYKDEHGDTLVPAAHQSLGKWVIAQRMEYREHCADKRSMPQERINLLNSIDFEFDPFEEQWLHRFNELCAYKEEHGDTLVRSRSNDGLGAWVMTQKTAYREHCEGKRSMPQERVDRLNSIGFVWRVRSRSDKALN